MSYEGYLALPPDSSGKRVRTIVKEIDGQARHHEVMCITSPKTLLGVYHYCSTMLTGSTDAEYIYHAIYNPKDSPRNMALRRIILQLASVKQATPIEIAVWRITDLSGGVDVDPSRVCKKDTDYADPIVTIKEGSETNPITATIDNKICGTMTPINAGQYIWIGFNFVNAVDQRSDFILHAGEGICMRNEESGDVDFRILWIIEWEEFTGIGVIT